MTQYQIGGKGGRRFATRAEAERAAAVIFAETGAVVCIAQQPARQARPHYHVLCGIGGGYLPNENVYCVTKRDAIAFAREEAARVMDGEYESLAIDPTYTPRRKAGDIHKDLLYTFVRPNDAYDLGYYIAVVACRDECDPDAEN